MYKVAIIKTYLDWVTYKKLPMPQTYNQLIKSWMSYIKDYKNYINKIVK